MNHLGTRTPNNEMALCDAWCPVAFPKCPWANWNHQNPLEKLNGFVYWGRWELKQSEAIRQDFRSPDFIDRFLQSVNFLLVSHVGSRWKRRQELRRQTEFLEPWFQRNRWSTRRGLVASSDVMSVTQCVPPDSDGRTPRAAMLRAQWFSEVQRLFRQLVSR